MAGYNRNKRGKQDDIFFSDNLNAQEKEAVSKQFAAKDMDISKAIEAMVTHGLSVKILWSEYNDSYSVTVSPTDRDHPSNGTFYSGFHANWEKAVFLTNYLLASRYDYGDWTKDRAKKFDNDW